MFYYNIQIKFQWSSDIGLNIIKTQSNDLQIMFNRAVIEYTTDIYTLNIFNV